MIVTLRLMVSRVAIVLFALFVTGFLAFFSIRAALASYYSQKGDLNGYERATALEPSNSEYWFLLGRFWQYNFENPDLELAISAYRKALSLNPESADVWADLATAYETANRLSESNDAYLKAKSIYPQSPDIAWRYGNFLLRQGKIPSAFSEIHRAVEIDPLKSAQAFSLLMRVDPNPKDLLDKVIPPTRIGYLAILQSVDEGRDLDAGLLVWERLVPLQPRIRPQEVAELVGHLEQAGRIEDAKHVWNQAITLVGLNSMIDTPGSVLWDGGFESGIAGFGYAWTYSASVVHGVHIYRDSQQPHSGHFSLRLTFDGRADLNFLDVCHRIPVQQGRRYEFSAWVRSDSITTDEGVRFVLWALSVSNKNTVATEDIRGTQPWTLLSTSWLAPPGAREAQACAVRRASVQPDNKIKGSVWIDDVSMVPEPSPGLDH